MAGVKGATHMNTLLMTCVGNEKRMRVIRKITNLALEGDPTALKIWSSRHYRIPNVISQPFALPPLTDAASALSAIARIANQAASGLLGLDEAEKLSKLCRDFLDSLTATEIESRVRAIEEKLNPAAAQSLDDLEVGDE